MNRGRAWRRYETERIIKKRLQKNNRKWYYFGDSNGNILENPIWIDMIGTYIHFRHKTLTNLFYNKFKAKYGKKGRKRYWSSSDATRPRDRMKFIRMLYDEYGLKPHNTR